jgi:hypothetical protein
VTAACTFAGDPATSEKLAPAPVAPICTDPALNTCGCSVSAASCSANSVTWLAPLAGRSAASSVEVQVSAAGAAPAWAWMPSRSICGSAALPEVWAFHATTDRLSPPLFANATVQGAAGVPLPVTAVGSDSSPATSGR